MFGWTKAKGAAASSRGAGFLTRLARDTRGNTLAIVGAALVPLAAMIGSGVDMSRAYMAKNRLQNACDAAALAGRRIMQNDTMTTAVGDEARRFFRFNFPQTTTAGTTTGPYGTDPVTPTVSRPTSGTVRVAASTRIPTTIMSMFGFTHLPLNVTCDASLNFVNTDVMLVLDVTGSMSEDLNGTQKIVALREAVMALYDELRPIQTQLEANGMRLRYGVVPYSTTVNVGALLRSANPDYIADNPTYRSRVANYDDLEVEYIPSTQPPQPAVTQNYAGSISQANCDKYGRNIAFTGFSPSPATGGGPAPSDTWTRAYSNNESAGVDWGWSGSDTSGSTRSCRRRYIQTNTSYTANYYYRSSGYTWQEETVDVSDYKMGGSITIATNNAGRVEDGGSFDPFHLPTVASGVATTTLAPWNGCIEERETVNTITPTSGYNIPSDAYDLQINLVPFNDDTRWRPMIPALYYAPGSSSAYPSYAAPCPAAARRLTAWQRSDMQAYVNGLLPTGNTYHDTGMIWGARMISNGGVFADSPDAFAGMPVSRHIIFMSDGQMDTDRSIYSLYGVERYDQRISGQSAPSEAELNGRHMQRYKMICNAAKSMNVSIWVIAFGTALSPEMLECASNANQASTVGDRDALIARFRQIGSQIGALRLTQ